LEKLNEPKIQDWISFYKTPWILASLTQAYTKMPTNLWNSTPFDTNIAESAMHLTKKQKGVQRTAPIKKKAKTTVASKKTEKLSSNYAESSTPIFSKEEREFALKEKEVEISIKEREVALEIKKKQESLIELEKQKLENERVKLELLAKEIELKEKAKKLDL
ncbi:11021_t:CDS:2, partial [Gigaspora rosea]